MAKKIKTKEKVDEIFEIEKNDKEKIVESKGIEIKKEEQPDKKSIEKENKILRNVLISIGVFVLVLLIIVFVAKSMSHFKYKGVKFDIVQEGELILYHSTFPVIYNGTPNTYNIYLRNDPRDLDKKVPAKGTLLSIDDAVINMSGDFKCDGDGVIAIANLANLYTILGKSIIKDENAGCDIQGRYMYLQIQESNETNIEMFGPNCYNININNCEILEGTERFIAGMLVYIKTYQETN